MAKHTTQKNLSNADLKTIVKEYLRLTRKKVKTLQVCSKLLELGSPLPKELKEIYLIANDVDDAASYERRAIHKILIERIAKSDFDKLVYLSVNRNVPYKNTRERLEELRSYGITDYETL